MNPPNSCRCYDIAELVNLYRILKSELDKRGWTFDNLDISFDPITPKRAMLNVYGDDQFGKPILKEEVGQFFLDAARRME